MRFFLSLYKISLITNGILIGENIYVNNISIDTRNSFIINSLFIVIKGNYNNKFLCFNAIKNGASALLVNKYFFIKNIPQIIVFDTKIALGKIVSWLRKKNSATFICITGSTGKTTVKEIISNILKQSGNVLYNYLNYNNNIGIPMTLLNLQYFKYKYVVLELGGNKIGDINYLSKIILPNISCLTNISISHLKGFKNIFNIIVDKGKIFKYLLSNGIAFINENFFYFKFWNKYLYNKKVILFSLFNLFFYNIIINKIKCNIYGTFLYLRIYKKNFKIYLKLLGLHNVLNVILSIIFSLYLGVNLQDIIIGIESLFPIKRRLYPIFLKKKKIILDDSYNCNPRSLYFSLLFLQKCSGYKILVIGDMLELSNMSIYYHKKIGLLIRYKKINIDKILSIGKYSYYISKYSLIGEHFYSFNNLLNKIKNMLVIFNDITILIKGSNFFNMNNIINYL